MTIYRRVWQQHHNQSIPKGWHIHHIDGNQSNNVPENLMCVSPYVHWCIHFLQGDPIGFRGKFINGAGKANKGGYQLSEETKQKMRKPKSEEHKRKIKENKNWLKRDYSIPNTAKCIYCGKEAMKSNITKWHNEKCKNKPLN